MPTFGASRKQTRPNTTNTLEYLGLGSEPVPSGEPLPKLPRFTYANRYIMKRRMMRRLRHLRNGTW